MKPTALPLFCGLALAAMSAAGLSHWWSVRQFALAFDQGIPAPAMVAKAAAETKKPVAESVKPAPSAAPAVAAVANAGPQKEFYETLLKKLAMVESQNHDLLNQMAETNRDVMKLEFRVDTHSESFRPMVVSEELPETTFDDSAGVLPPRAEPVFGPSN